MKNEMLERAKAFIETADIFAGGEPNATVAKWLSDFATAETSALTEKLRIAEEALEKAKYAFQLLANTLTARNGGNISKGAVVEITQALKVIGGE